MAIINENIRYIRLKNGYSQQKLAELTGVNRGKLNSYEMNSEPRHEFLLTFVNLFTIDLKTLLTVRITDYNYEGLVNASDEEPKANNAQASPTGKYRRTDFFSLMLAIKAEQDQAKRSAMVDQAISLVTLLEDEYAELMKELQLLIAELKKLP